MSSMQRLNRNLARWERYARKTYWSPRVTRPAWMGLDTAKADGHTRAWDAREAERQRREDRAARRFAHDTAWEPRSWVDDFDPRCCLAGDEDHPGPCVRTCQACGGDGCCPECGGQDDLGCHFCGGSGSCPEGCDRGQIVDDDWIAPARPIVTVNAGGMT